MEWRAFDTRWFARHQRVLLQLLAWPLVGRWARWLLCIRACDVGSCRPIVQLLPHAYTVVNPDGTFTADVRTHPKFAKRIYYALKPLWWLLHWWDLGFANPLVPQWNLGFDVLARYPDPGTGVPPLTTCNGVVGFFDSGFGQDFTSLRAMPGNEQVMGIEEAGWLTLEPGMDGFADTWARLWRYIMLFDTSTLVPGTVTISAATISLWGVMKTNTYASDPTIDICTSFPASNTTLVPSDYQNLGTVSQTGAPISYVAFSTSSYNVFTLNATGRGNIIGGVSKFGARFGNWDMGVATPPPWLGPGASGQMRFMPADAVGLAQDPKLDVTYTALLPTWQMPTYRLGRRTDA